MVYKQEYVLAIIQNGKIVPEKSGDVTLPYGSEYKIRLKNKSRVRSVADVYIDGTIVCKGLIVDADGTVDLERYIRPGIDSLTNGPRFKLARLNHPGVADANDCQNGLLEVRFYKEMAKPKTEYVITPTPPIWQPPYYRQEPVYPWQVITTTTTGDCMPMDCMPMDCSRDIQPCCNYNATLSHAPVHTKSIDSPLRSKFESMKSDGPAATVQGSLSSQRVENVIMEIDETKFETLSLRLFGVTKITRHEKCPTCKRKRRGNERFCPSCGEALVIEG